MTAHRRKREDGAPLSAREAHLKAFLDGLYFAYCRRELIQPDPLGFLYTCAPKDREVVGLIASSLAYGRVAQILRSVQFVLERLGPHPRQFLLEHTGTLEGLLGPFRHRFTTAGEMEGLFTKMAAALREHGSLEGLMRCCLERSGGELFRALDFFSDALSSGMGGFPLIPAPRDGSACKRLFLFLKWMTRCDSVDPGGWTALSPRDLIMPVDTHIHAIALRLGLTRRKQADLKAAVEITRALARLRPEDPTRYDFVLTRFGIRDGLSVDALARLAAGGPPKGPNGV
ncbi:MAG: TIGR02757 family protein [Fretibacterium sp.]|nr:TIGR02757 family protein [Fretibacterium sp.]